MGGMVARLGEVTVRRVGVTDRSADGRMLGAATVRSVRRSVVGHGGCLSGAVAVGIGVAAARPVRCLFAPRGGRLSGVAQLLARFGEVTARQER
ncbi:hypothetical protein [Streptomyces prunicolor]